MEIPNDKGGSWRLEKFIEYQRYAVSMDCSDFLSPKLDLNGTLNCFFLFSLTYNEATSLFLAETFDIYKHDLQGFWDFMKPHLRFNSAKEKAKNMNHFVPSVSDWIEMTNGEPYEWLKKNRDIEDLRKSFLKIRNIGDFSWTRFFDGIDGYCLRNGKIGELKFDRKQEWEFKHGRNLTSGLLNVFYHDKEADDFDVEVLTIENDPKRIEEGRRLFEFLKIPFYCFYLM